MARRHAGAQVFAVVVLMLLAGCFGGADDPEPADGAPGGDGDGGEAPGGGSAQAAGSIKGRVLTDAFDPVAEAELFLLEGEALVASTLSAGDGRFVFEDVPPADYRVRVNHVCCEDGLQAVYLVGGATETLDFALKPIPLEQPYQEPLQWTGFMACGAAVLGSPFAAACADPQHDVIHEFKESRGLMSLVVALEWEPVGTHVADTLRIIVQHNPDGGNWYTYADVNGDSPLTLHINSTGHGDSSFAAMDDEEWRFRFMVRPAGALNVIYQQPFTVHYHKYYWAEAPEEASALPL